MSETKIKYIDHSAIPEDCRVCLYGIGKGGSESLKLLRQLRPDVEIVCFADTYQSGYFEGFEIFSPEELSARKNEYDFILVCSYFYPEIITNLHSLGIENVAGFSWPKFYNYQFLPGDLTKFKTEINFILNNLHSDSDRDLFKVLCEARVVGSDSVELIHISNEMGNFAFKEPERIKSFPEHTARSYFDFVNISAVKYVVQAGVYDGSEALFLSGLDQLKMIYGFEPLGDSAFSDETKRKLHSSEKFTLIRKGLWSEGGAANFSRNGSASFVKGVAEDQDSEAVYLAALDHEAKRLAIPRLDLLIADIENSEIPMLEGAMDIIQRDRPQLAICFYHSKEQFLGIPLMLMKRLKDYIFKIGHYSDTLDESVFYAIPKYAK